MFEMWDQAQKLIVQLKNQLYFVTKLRKFHESAKLCITSKVNFLGFVFIFCRCRRNSRTKIYIIYSYTRHKNYRIADLWIDAKRLHNKQW